MIIEPQKGPGTKQSARGFSDRLGGERSEARAEVGLTELAVAHPRGAQPPRRAFQRALIGNRKENQVGMVGFGGN